ncbi:transposase family protein [Streptomyces violascens]|uniref:transposase family protein n=1 Tax=Streptomyces violascens TaxID=67381 RepID=UPI00379E7D15
MTIARGAGALIDGSRRCSGRADRRNYSVQHRGHGLRSLALTDENGRLTWTSAAWPGNTHDTAAARHDRILAHLRAAGLGALADLGFLSLDNDLCDLYGGLNARTPHNDRLAHLSSGVTWRDQAGILSAGRGRDAPAAPGEYGPRACCNDTANIFGSQALRAHRSCRRTATTATTAAARGQAAYAIHDPLMVAG